jgi:hypothetical protein
LCPAIPAFRDYGRNPYAGYDSAAKPFLYAGDLPDGIDPMARVVVAKPPSAAPVIVALAHLREKGTVSIGALEFSWRAGQSSAVDAARSPRAAMSVRWKCMTRRMRQPQARAI